MKNQSDIAIAIDKRNRQTINKLLKKLLEKIELENNNRIGICYFIITFYMKYPSDEVDLLQNFVNKNRPKINGLHKRFAKHEHATPHSEWWWLRTQQGFELRKEFLKVLIEQTN